MANFYLMNGSNRAGNALYVVKDKMLYKDFDDIASIDLATMDISSDSAKAVLSKCNDPLNLNGKFYVASYPHTRTFTEKQVNPETGMYEDVSVKKVVSKTYIPLFDYDEKFANYYIDKLRSYAEKRIYNKRNKKNLALDYDADFVDYYTSIIYDIFACGCYELFRDESIMSPKLKQVLNDYRYSSGSLESYLHYHFDTLKSLLTGYIELRNLTQEYVNYKLGLNTNLRYIKSYAYWNNNGMEPMKPVKYKEEKKEPIIVGYEQMDLSSFMDMSRTLKK